MINESPIARLRASRESAASGAAPPPAAAAGNSASYDDGGDRFWRKFDVASSPLASGRGTGTGKCSGKGKGPSSSRCGVRGGSTAAHGLGDPNQQKIQRRKQPVPAPVTSQIEEAREEAAEEAARGDGDGDGDRDTTREEQIAVLDSCCSDDDSGHPPTLGRRRLGTEVSLVSDLFGGLGIETNLTLSAAGLGGGGPSASSSAGGIIDNDDDDDDEEEAIREAIREHALAKLEALEELTLASPRDLPPDDDDSDDGNDDDLTLAGRESATTNHNKRASAIPAAVRDLGWYEDQASTVVGSPLSHHSQQQSPRSPQASPHQRRGSSSHNKNNDGRRRHHRRHRLNASDHASDLAEAEITTDLRSDRRRRQDRRQSRRSSHLSPRRTKGRDNKNDGGRRHRHRRHRHRRGASDLSNTEIDINLSTVSSLRSPREEAQEAPWTASLLASLEAGVLARLDAVERAIAGAGGADDLTADVEQLIAELDVLSNMMSIDFEGDDDDEDDDEEDDEDDDSTLMDDSDDSFDSTVDTANFVAKSGLEVEVSLQPVVPGTPTRKATLTLRDESSAWEEVQSVPFSVRETTGTPSSDKGAEHEGRDERECTPGNNGTEDGMKKRHFSFIKGTFAPRSRTNGLKPRFVPRSMSSTVVSSLPSPMVPGHDTVLAEAKRLEAEARRLEASIKLEEARTAKAAARAAAEARRLDAETQRVDAKEALRLERAAKMAIREEALAEKIKEIRRLAEKKIQRRQAKMAQKEASRLEGRRLKKLASGKKKAARKQAVLAKQSISKATANAATVSRAVVASVASTVKKVGGGGKVVEDTSVTKIDNDSDAENADNKVKEEIVSSPVEEVSEEDEEKEEEEAAEEEDEERRDVNDDEKEIAQEEPIDEELASTEAETVPAERTSEDTVIEDVKEGPEDSTPKAAAEDSSTAENKRKNTLLLKDLEDKEVKRKAKFDKISDFEAYLASVTSCASDKEGTSEAVDHVLGNFVGSAFGDTMTTPTLSSAGEQHLQFPPNVSITTIEEDVLVGDDQTYKNLPSLTEDHDIVLGDTSVTNIDNDPDDEEEKATIDENHDGKFDVNDVGVEQNEEETNDENQNVDFDVDVKEENSNASGLTRTVVHISRT